MINNTVKFFLLAIGLMLITSCSKDIPLTNPDLTEQQNVFKEYWDIYDKYYPLMHRKNIDWQEVYDTYYPQITATTTDAELFDIFNTIMSTIIKDGHSNLIFDDMEYTEFIPDFNEDVQLMIQTRADKINIVATSADNPYISYGTLVSDENIGYIYSKGFEPLIDNNSEFNKFKAIVDEALTALEDKEGIIVDVSSNFGGQGSFAYYLAGRFFSNTTPFQLVRMRYKTTTGSTVSSLSNWVNTMFDGFEDSRSEEGVIGSIYPDEFIVEASGPFQFTNKVAVLTSRFTGSAAEYFTAAMKNQDHVKTIGNTTLGIFAGSEKLTLTNGGGKWNTQVSVQDVELFYGGNFQSFEGIGIVPDELSIPSAADLSAGKDLHLEAAVNYIK